MEQIRTSDACAGTKARTGEMLNHPAQLHPPIWSRVNIKSSVYLSFYIFPTRKLQDNDSARKDHFTESDRGY